MRLKRISNDDRKIILKHYVKAMNDTIGENGLVPYVLVFSITPRLAKIHSDLSNQKERMKIMSNTQMEMNFIIAKRCLTFPPTKYVPSHKDNVYQNSEQVLVYSETQNHWMEPIVA